MVCASTHLAGAEWRDAERDAGARRLAHARSGNGHGSLPEPTQRENLTNTERDGEGAVVGSSVKLVLCLRHIPIVRTARSQSADFLDNVDLFCLNLCRQAGESQTNCPAHADLYRKRLQTQPSSDRVMFVDTVQGLSSTLAARKSGIVYRSSQGLQIAHV